MEIEVSIDYWGEEVLTFDPEKVLWRLKNYFQQIEIDPIDYSFDELERFITYSNEKVYEPTRSMVIASRKGKNRTSGPVFRFQIPVTDKLKIKGYAKRYTVAFNFEWIADEALEEKIIVFLKSLNYGEIRSDTQTKKFCIPHKELKNNWTLKLP